MRMEYKHCPNLTIIDTPGAIGAGPGLWGDGDSTGWAATLRSQSRQVVALPCVSMATAKLAGLAWGIGLSTAGS